MHEIILSVLLILGGSAIFVLGSPYYTVFPTNDNQTYYIGLVIVFLVASVILKRSQPLARYWPAAYSLGIASAALLFFSTGILNLPRDNMTPLQDLAVDKFSQFLHVVPVLIGFTLLAKDDLRSIFLKRGYLRWGLVFGLVSFVGFGTIAFVTQLNSSEFFSALSTAVPWLLLFIFANAIMEELWFRGIFLRKYEALIGRKATIIVTAVVFGAPHVFATMIFSAAD